MPNRITLPVLSAWIGLFSLLGVTGCAAIPGSKEMMKLSFASMKPSTGDYANDIENSDEGWVQEAGIEARGDRPLEKSSDPIRDLIMSPKARSIERNLGFE